MHACVGRLYSLSSVASAWPKLADVHTIAASLPAWATRTAEIYDVCSICYAQ